MSAAANIHTAQRMRRRTYHISKSPPTFACVSACRRSEQRERAATHTLTFSFLFSSSSFAQCSTGGKRERERSLLPCFII
jgi:hypothetical protein